MPIDCFAWRGRLHGLDCFGYGCICPTRVEGRLDCGMGQAISRPRGGIGGGSKRRTYRPIVTLPTEIICPDLTLGVTVPSLLSEAAIVR
eukprot:scaffold175279_cov25-Prasinocladus_malaysianus.AAC.2